MPVWLLPLLKLFATPLGALVNKFLAGAGVSIVTWAVAHGAPLDATNSLVGEFIFAVSSAIAMLASSQGVTIPVINASDNGLVVVPATQANVAQETNSPKS